MPRDLPNKIKNVCIVGHGDSGKTTLADALLFEAKAVPRRGSVKEKTSVFDFDDLEKEQGHSIDSAVARCVWDEREINIIDTPGYPDYIGEAYGAMAACEGVIVCVNAHTGVQVNTRRTMALAEKLGRARMIVVTKCDLQDIDLDKLILDIQSWFGECCIPVTWPAAVGDGFAEPHRILKNHGGDSPREQEYYQNFVESAVEVYDDIMTRYLEGEEICKEDLKRCFIKAVLDGKLVPILFTSMEKNIGAHDVLDAIVDFFPNTAYRGKEKVYEDRACTQVKGEVEISFDAPFLGQVFKLQIDRHVGKIAYVKIVTGHIHAGDFFYHAEGGRKEKMGHILLPMGKDQVTGDDAVAGEIVTLTKIDSLHIGDTIASYEHSGYLGKISFPKPMASVAVRPKSRSDETKISEALHKLDEEIPTFSVHRDPITNEAIASGMSSLHLNVIFRRLHDRYGIDVDLAPARIPYREAITTPADGHYRHKKQTGGRGQFGEVYLSVRPAEPGSGLEFEWKIVGGSIPTNFAPAIEKGIREKMIHGVIAGYPIHDIHVTVTDGKFHDVDSSEAAFKIAGGRAFADAVHKARPVLLEPMVDAEIVVPSDYMGDITGDLNTRRGRIQGMDAKGSMQVIRAHVPKSEMAEYPRVITSLTSGEGSFSYDEAGYEQVPGNVQQEIIAAFKPREEEE
ncbi:MAG: elongation factor G [Planctomycetes bacterium]|nr:elongation factor G [Planctomycetota bacterium]